MALCSLSTGSRVTAVLADGAQHQRAGHHHHFLVGEGDVAAGLDGRERRPKPDGAHQRGDAQIRGVRRDRPQARLAALDGERFAEAGAQRLGVRGLARTDTRSGRKRSIWPHSLSTLRPAASATARKRSGAPAITSRVCSPTLPVLPRMETRFTNAPRDRPGRAPRPPLPSGPDSRAGACASRAASICALVLPKRRSRDW